MAIGLVALATLAACTSGGPGKTGPSGSGAPAGGTVVTLRLRVTDAGFALQAPVQREVAVLSAGSILIAGGLGADGQSASGIYRLAPPSGQLSQLGTFPQPFHDAAGAMLGGRLFVFGGGTGESSDVVQAFDPSSKSAYAVGHLPQALSDLSSAVAGAAVYLVGGWDGTTYNSSIYATTDGVRLRVAGRLPVGLRYVGAAAVGTTVVMAGGETPAGPVDTVYALDTRSGNVSVIGHLPQPLGHAAAFALGSIVYVAGGEGAGGTALSSAFAVDPARRSITRQPNLPSAVSDAGVASDGRTAWLVGGLRGQPVSQVLRATVQRVVASARPSGSRTTIGPSPTDWAAERPFAGLLLVADRGNNRLLVLNAKKQVLWRYPDPSLPARPFPFYFPDDAFWVHHGHAILVSEEENSVIEEIAYPSGKAVWWYGHAGVPGSSPGFLDQPDDAYPYPGGGVVVADAKNCRILFFDAQGHASRQIGVTASADTPGACYHALPNHVAYPNGDTPLPDGHILISELRGGGWIDEVTADGHPVWQTRVPGIQLPSDPQRLADGSFLSVDYGTPGRIVRFSSDGTVLWQYHVTSGPGVLSNPSLAAPLPNGLIAVNDDYVHRVVLIDPATNRIVWQYGVRGVSGTSHGYLNLPDGLDLLLPDGTAPLHVDFPTSQVVSGRP